MTLMESSGDTVRDGRHSGALAAIIIALVLYLLPLVAVAIDELALRTFWFARTFPEESRSVFLTVYPFLRWFFD
jgi:hypothetical protein